MTQKNLSYSLTTAGILAAINQLQEQLLIVCAQETLHQSKLPAVIQQFGLDDELTREMLADFASANGFSKNIVSMVWDVLTSYVGLTYRDPCPIYIGNLLDNEVSRRLSAGKRRAFVKEFLLCHAKEHEDTNGDWLEPDLRPQVTTSRSEEWTLYDVVIKREDIDVLKNHLKAERWESLPWDFISQIFTALTQSKSSIPFGRRLRVGHLAHVEFLEMAKTFVFDNKKPWPPHHIERLFEVFMHYFGVELQSTPKGWTPIDIKAE